MTELQKDLETIRKDAERYEFILYIRGLLERFEKEYCTNLPDEKNFLTEIRKLHPTIMRHDIFSGLHFRKWLWLLLTANENFCEQISRLRVALQSDVKRYIWFAKQIQTLYSVLSDEVHSLSLLSIQYIRKEKLPEYLSFFSEDIRKALTTFMASGS